MRGQWSDMIVNFILRYGGRLHLQPNSQIVGGVELMPFLVHNTVGRSGNLRNAILSTLVEFVCTTLLMPPIRLMGIILINSTSFHVSLLSRVKMNSINGSS